MARVLVIDDDADVRRVIQRVLERRGHTVALAADGLEGVRRWREQGADIVLLDIHMPRADGLETLVQLRALHPEVPVVVISGGRQTEGMDLLGDASLLGATRILAKPFSAPELSRAITETLAERRPG
jgi:CheY-like chemotaxis protein